MYYQLCRKRKQEGIHAGDMNDSLVSFVVCPNCKQDYQNEVAYELSAAQVDFVERDFAGEEHGFLYTNVLRAD